MSVISVVLYSAHLAGHAVTKFISHVSDFILCPPSQGKRDVTANSSCVRLCVWFSSWQSSASCSGTSVSSAEDLYVKRSSPDIPVCSCISALHCTVRVCVCARVCVCVCVCVLAVYYQCVLGRSCRSGGKCLSSSQWCDGVTDCPNGEDESQCSKICHSQSTYCVSIIIHGWAAWFSLHHSSSSRDQLHTGELLTRQPEVDARVRWEVEQRLWDDCVPADGLHEVLTGFFTAVWTSTHTTSTMSLYC